MSPPTALNGSEITSPITLTVPLRTPVSSLVVLVVVVVSLSTVTGSPVRRSYCTSCVTVLCVEHANAKLASKNTLRNKFVILRMTFLLPLKRSRSQTRATASHQAFVRQVPELGHDPRRLLRNIGS